MLNNKLTLLIAIAAGTGTTAGACAATTKFAFIGDYGVDNGNQLAVANRLKASDAQFVCTTGDNTYSVGSTAAQDFANWDRTNGKYYGSYIKLPAGSAFGPGSAVNNFFPSVGNHDIDEGTASFNTYFSSLPKNPSGNSNYYKFTRGDAEFFAVSADPREVDGRTAGTKQYNYFKTAIQTSTAKFKFVYFHQPAWTYGTTHGPETAMRWPFADWGVTAVFSGHNHNMQDMTITDAGAVGLPYFVIGSSGNALYSISGPPSGAIGNWSNASSFGFLSVSANGDTNTATVNFVDAAGNVLRSRSISVPEPSVLALLAPVTLLAIRRGKSR